MRVRVSAEWRLTSATQFRFLELINQYEQVHEDSEEAAAICEDIKSLPGYPLAAPVGSDILLVVTDTQN